MDNPIIDLINKRMDDHREDSRRRFDDLSTKIEVISQEIATLKEWKWTTKGKVAVMTVIGGGFFAFAFEYMKSLIK